MRFGKKGKIITSLLLHFKYFIN